MLRIAMSRGFVLAVMTLLFHSMAASLARAAEPDPAIERGRYLVVITGCNDCHTPGYMEQPAEVDESVWLTGNTVGWYGPWGTTYPSNLRLVAQRLTEAQWLVHARNEWRPPMPWYANRKMKDEDLAAIYRFLRFLGPAGEPAPAALPPGQAPQGPAFRAPEPPAAN